MIPPDSSFFTRSMTAGADKSTCSAISASRRRPSTCKICSIFKSVSSKELIKLGIVFHLVNKVNVTPNFESQANLAQNCNFFRGERNTRLTTARGWCGDFLARKPGLSAKKALFVGRSEIQTVPGSGDSIQLSGRSGLGVDSSIKASAAHGQSIMSVGFNVINFC